MMDQQLWAKLKAAWESLDTDQRFEVLDHARWLAGDSRLVGGPCDGLRVPDRFKDQGIGLSIEVNGKAALYERDGEMLWRFAGFHRIGGEGSTWPDIRAEELQSLKGGAQ